MSSFVLEAPESVTVRSVAEFHPLLLEAVEAHDEVVLDLGALAELDLGFVQLVESARAFQSGKGGALSLAAPAAEPVAALLDRAGFLADPAPADIQFWFHGELPQ